MSLSLQKGARNMKKIMQIRSFSTNNKNQNDFHNEHVYKVYNKIAEHFSATRYKAWPRVVNFLQHVKKGSIVLDIGCGNGRNMGVNPAIQMIGIDRCFPLLNIAKDRGENRALVHADALRLPLRSQSFDAAISIALIHHFQSFELRQKILKQIGRVLKRKSKALIYVRSVQVLNHKNELVRQMKTQDFLDPWHLHKKYETDLQKAIKQGHQYIQQKNSIIYERFYHTFVEGELQNLIKSTNQFLVIKPYYDKNNWACIVEKI